MASVIRNRSGAWELRESVRTAKGPRSRTLATFRTLTPETIAHAQARASQPLDPAELRHAAARAGAPVASSSADNAAAELLRELAAGHRPRATLARLLADALGQAPQAALNEHGRARPRTDTHRPAAQTAASKSLPRPADARLRPTADAPSDAARAAAAWVGATVQQRGEALRDLLLLTDRLPARRLPERPRFPRISSQGA